MDAMDFEYGPTRFETRAPFGRRFKCNQSGQWGFLAGASNKITQSTRDASCSRWEEDKYRGEGKMCSSNFHPRTKHFPECLVLSLLVANSGGWAHFSGTRALDLDNPRSVVSKGGRGCFRIAWFIYPKTTRLLFVHFGFESALSLRGQRQRRKYTNDGHFIFNFCMAEAEAVLSTSTQISNFRNFSEWMTVDSDRETWR